MSTTASQNTKAKSSETSSNAQTPKIDPRSLIMGKIFEAKAQGKTFLEVDRETLQIVAGPEFTDNELSFLGIELFLEGKASEILANRTKSIVDINFPKG